MWQGHTGLGTVLSLCDGFSRSRAFSAPPSGVKSDASGLSVMTDGDKGDEGHAQDHIEH